MDTDQQRQPRAVLHAVTRVGATEVTKVTGRLTHLIAVARAAIPAVVAYNKISNSIDALSDRLGTFAEELSVVISREIDSRKAAA